MGFVAQRHGVHRILQAPYPNPNPHPKPHPHRSPNPNPKLNPSPNSKLNPNPNLSHNPNLQAADIVAPVERLDESLVLLNQLAGYG